jgi:hypothetical protein
LASKAYAVPQSACSGIEAGNFRLDKRTDSFDDANRNTTAAALLQFATNLE